MTDVKVGIKIRPLLESEAKDDLAWTVEGKQVISANVCGTKIMSSNGKHNLVFGESPKVN